MDIPLVKLAALQKRKDESTNSCSEIPQSPTKRKSAIAASSAWKSSGEWEADPQYWSDLSLDDSDTDPDFVIPKKVKKADLPLTPTCSNDKSGGYTALDSSLPNSEMPTIVDQNLEPSTSSQISQETEQAKPKRKRRSRDENSWTRNKRKQLKKQRPGLHNIKR